MALQVFILAWIIFSCIIALKTKSFVAIAGGGFLGSIFVIIIIYAIPNIGKNTNATKTRSLIVQPAKIKPAPPRIVSTPAESTPIYSKTETRANTFSGLATTTVNSIGCFTKTDLEEMVRFTVSGDRESFAAYIMHKKCIVLAGGLDVTVVEYPGMFSGTPCFVYRGVKLWTTRSGLTNYR